MNLNRIQIIGNLTADPSFGESVNGSRYATLTVATNHRWRTRDGKQNDEPEFHHIQAWDSLAEAIQQTGVVKGDLVMIEGRNRTRSYTDKDGREMTTTEIVAHTFANLFTKTQALKRRHEIR